MSKEISVAVSNLAAEIESMAGDFANNSDDSLVAQYETHSFRLALSKLLKENFLKLVAGWLLLVWLIFG